MSPRTAAVRLRADRLGRRLVVVGGMAIIASVLGILIFIVAQSLPLFLSAKVRPVGRISLSGLPAGEMLADESRRAGVFLGTDGQVRLFHLGEGREQESYPLFPGPGPAPTLARVALVPGSPWFLAGTTDGRLAAWAVKWIPGNPVPRPELEAPAWLEMDPRGRPLTVFGAGIDGDGGITAAAALPEGRLAIVRRSVADNEFTGERTVTLSRTELPAPEFPAVLAVAAHGKAVFGGAASGSLFRWRLAEGPAEAPERYQAGKAGITALTLLTGHQSLVVGQADGSLSVWFPVRQPDQSFRLTRIREMPRLAEAVALLSPHPRTKGFLAAGEQGELGYFHSTSGKRLWHGAAGAPVRSLQFFPKGEGHSLLVSGQVSLWELDCPHPEISLRALFGKVWYEGYDQPRFVWQSSASTDDVEPKLSLTPLLVGTLKGTFYSLILAIPLGVLGAMYTSQFLHHSLKRIVKPTVEIMAALPSVVLGFLAGLWLAPRIDKVFPALILMGLFLPAATLGGGWLFRALPVRFRSRFPAGSEAVLGIGTLALGVALSLWLEPGFERVAFGGSFQGWMLEMFGLPYDQRNAVVVGLAMGFAVIPIIFSVSEESFSNVPQNLVAGSLALGASRWETVTRIVLPSASPGIFSAIMIGFGRAVGETMIVLMATGNTPIMDWNPFNGFRTLSANIAVEIPEAPEGGTLFRTLFLAGLLLFIFTFAVNTAAELVRQNLRRRFSNL